MAKELKVERRRSRLNIEEMTCLLYGGSHNTMKRREAIELIFSDPIFSNKDKYFHSHEEAYDDAIKKAVHLVEVTKGLNDDVIDYAYELLPLSSFINKMFFSEVIKSQGTKEQIIKWAGAADRYDIIGTYAQTEMGHGTFLRGLETTATYDSSTEEFIINSPTLTSMKWWPGRLGHTATHAIVVARLITRGKDEGIHLFIVQLRSLEDHTPLPGIKVGDIGPKFGVFGLDNGFLQLSNVRIPRDQMLMKYAQVSSDGVYTKPPTDKITYGSMVNIRTLLVHDSSVVLAIAITIAIRYSVVRRQTQNRPGEPETQILDYQTQQFKLFPLLAAVYAIKFASHFIAKLHRKVTEDISKGNLQSLQELHATSAGLKAFCTELSSNGTEVCRLCCGGHGYSAASGLPILFANNTSAQTVEGENTVMYLQTARYLHKMLQKRLPQTQLPTNICYIAVDYPQHTQCSIVTLEQFNDSYVLLEAYRQRAKRLVSIAMKRYSTCEIKDPFAAWNNSSVDWMNAAKAHCYYMILKSFQSTIDSAVVCEANLHILKVLFKIFGLHGIVQHAGEFCLDGYMNSHHIDMARTQLYTLLTEIRYEAVPLVDAFDFHDEMLNSCLGRYDGDVYKHMYEWALRAPRNKKEVHDVYNKYLKPLLEKTKSKL